MTWHDIEGAKMRWMYFLAQLSSPFCKYLALKSHDQVLINVGTYDPKGRMYQRRSKLIQDQASLGSSKYLNQDKWNMTWYWRSQNEINVLFSSVFLPILQIFSLEVTLICDQGWINVGAYDSKWAEFKKMLCQVIKFIFFSAPTLLVVCPRAISKYFVVQTKRT